MARPVIGIPCITLSEQWYGPTNGNFRSYLQAVEFAGGIPLLIHLSDNEEVLRHLYDLCDGILFAGGDDLHPSCYGETAIPELGITDSAKDRTELRLAAWARHDQKPVLGICRGIQLINVAFGGTLYQDLPSQRPSDCNHRDSEDREDWTYLAHPIHFEPDSWLAEQLGSVEIVVNTLHHQAVKQLGEQLRVVAQAPDGLVEALEGTGEQFVAAVQCHPEMLWQEADLRWRKVFAAFVERCRPN